MLERAALAYALVIVGQPADDEPDERPDQEGDADDVDGLEPVGKVVADGYEPGDEVQVDVGVAGVGDVEHHHHLVHVVLVAPVPGVEQVHDELFDDELDAWLGGLAVVLADTVDEVVAVARAAREADGRTQPEVLGQVLRAELVEPVVFAPDERSLDELARVLGAQAGVDEVAPAGERRARLHEPVVVGARVGALAGQVGLEGAPQQRARLLDQLGQLAALRRRARRPHAAALVLALAALGPALSCRARQLNHFGFSLPTGAIGRVRRQAALFIRQIGRAPGADLDGARPLCVSERRRRARTCLLTCAPPPAAGRQTRAHWKMETRAGMRRPISRPWFARAQTQHRRRRRL